MTALTVQGRLITEVVEAYAVSRSWVYELLARYRTEGEAAFEARSRRPHHSPTAITDELIAAVLAERDRLTAAGTTRARRRSAGTCSRPASTHRHAPRSRGC
ncbi:leucine zipper domain-containing protein [Blastococcus sp. Marseille-P5729]|uniref:helix-turn-helix domain-containing protein n=1 Tax=Blastococcus sp. Marseille-P5729 TaxID=2086582 RepID=UPI0021016279|nr:leucine zipper domain-containing protein [Blastococcus sp. Marseille-P5729]